MKTSANDLERYRDKRDPTRTNEPFGAERIARARETWRGDFVVHQHGARRMHWDLRLEMAGTLTSFAVPRGPSLDPADKRLAVQTEDHPLEYLDFEDVIPEGNYGAGPMIVWDIGRVQYLEHHAEHGEQVGKLDFLLFGQKLQGRYALVLTGKNKDPELGGQRQWLLLKKPDVFVRQAYEITASQPHSVLSGLTIEQIGKKAEVARELEAEARERGAPEGEVSAAELVPMPCTTRKAELVDPARIYELELDGVRVIAQKQGDMVALRYGSSRQATTSYPEVVRAVRALAPERLVLDGEVVALDDQGRPAFEKLAPRLHARHPVDVAHARMDVPVSFVAFDVLQIGARDLRSLPLSERKALLRRLLPGRGVIWALDHASGDGRALFEWCRERRLEGVVSKRADGAYRPGPERTEDWIKHKCGRQDDFVVVGWIVEPKSRNAEVTLELASFAADRWVYSGRAPYKPGRALLAELLERLEASRTAADVLGTDVPEWRGQRTSVEPRLVVQVEYSEWSRDGRLSDPIIVGLRENAEPRECRAGPPGAPAPDLPEQERIESPPGSASPPRLAARSGAAAESVSTPREAVRSEAPALGARVALSNRDKVFWPDEGYTKGDMLDYYAAISDTLLPHLRDRPVMLVRYPDGIKGKSFYQWNVPRGTPSWIQTLSLRDEERDGKTVATFLVDGADALLHIVNLGCIPLHVLACRQQELEHCDFLTIDFDLGEQPLHQGVRLALSLRDLLGELGLVGYPKTSGQSGLHVLIPLGPGVTFDTAKALVELIGRVLQLRHAEVATMERRVSERRGRVYIDTGQTGRSRTIVAPYSVRAYPGASVSTPLYWEEVHMALDPRQLTMFTVPARVVDRGDPLEHLLDERPDIAHAVARLGELLAPFR
jgi:bifunctional non-homologous end joining protein LigD